MLYAIDKEDQKAFARTDIARLGAPQELADKMMEGNGKDEGDEG